MIHFHSRSRGFTLIELLVVIAIIGLLSSIVLASLSTARTKGQDAARILDTKSLKTAMELYYSDNHGYPTSNGSANGDVLLNDATLVSKLVPKYIGSMSALLVADNDHYYANGATSGVSQGYAVRIYTAAAKGNGASPDGACKTGINLGSGAWGTNTPFCAF